jgi:hypothetical protein
VRPSISGFASGYGGKLFSDHLGKSGNPRLPTCQI